MLNINGERWKIIMVSKEHPMLMRNDGTYTIGCCDDGLKSIFICYSLDELLMKKVLCHELTHAAMFSYNIVLDIAEEELLADLMATYGSDIIFTTNKIFNRLKEKRGRT